MYTAEINYCENAYVYNAFNGETGRSEIVLWDYYWGGHTGNKIQLGTHEIADEHVYAIRATTTDYQLFSMQVKPQYGKAYYQNIANEGGVLYFRYYLTGDKDGTPIMNLPVQILGSTVQTSKAFNTWHEVKIPAALIVEYYDYLLSAPKSTADVAKCSLLGVQNDDFANIAMYVTVPEFVFEPQTFSITLENEDTLVINEDIDLTKLSVTIDGTVLTADGYTLSVAENEYVTYANGTLRVSAATTVKILVHVNIVSRKGKIYRVVLTKNLIFVGNDHIYDGIAPDPYTPL